MSLVNSLAHPSEFLAMIKFKSSLPKLKIEEFSSNKQYCYKKLQQTSRSFAIVIAMLHEELRDAVMIFYLALRALDTVEDDMAFPIDKKVPMLRTFYQYLNKPGWNYDGCGYAEEKELLQNFDKLSAEHRTLKPSYQEVIRDITERMGNGMADFAERGRVDSVEDWNKYCHYVAGLVGIGLSRLFHASGLEDDWFESKADATANSMGLFLQKTNIIRDYMEDILETRIFWPTEIWSLYTDKLENFKEPEHIKPAIACLNHLITNALEHVPAVLSYLEHIKEDSVFTFCAIPQVMAIATLALCYNNPNVFKGVVKIRRGETAKIFTSIKGLDSIKYHFYHLVSEIERKIEPSDPNAQKTKDMISTIKSLCGNVKSNSSFTLSEGVLGAAAVLSSLGVAYLIGSALLG